jgi:polyhydroxybutyrate depolymerase
MRMFAFTVVSILVLARILPAQVIVGGDRPVEVHVPASYEDDVPMPLVLLLHGAPQTGAAVEGLFHLIELSESMGFLYAVPEGQVNSCGQQYWDAFDYCCANLCPAEPASDSAYLRGVIEEARAELNVDPARIHIVGFSAGGDMAHRMACDHGDLLAAVVSMSGSNPTDPAACPAREPLHVLQIQGTLDVYFSDGVFLGVPYFGAQKVVRLWRERNGCLPETDPPETADFQTELPGAETAITRFTKGCNAAGVSELWAVEGGGHFVGTDPLRTEMMRWLLAHPKRESPTALIAAEPAAGVVPLDVLLDAGGSTAPAGTTIERHDWDLGDGTTSVEAAPRHLYARPGRWLATLLVTTADGRTAADQETLLVRGREADTSPWQAADVGTPALPGSAAPSPGGAITLVAGGTGLNNLGRRDQTLFLSQEVAGDFRLAARFTEPEGGGPRPQVGLMVRAGREESAPMAALVLERGATVFLARLLGRREAGASASILGAKPTTLPSLAAWLALEREGQAVRAFWSEDGSSWNLVAEATLDWLPTTALAGPVASGSDVASDPPRSFVAFQATVSDLTLASLTPPVLAVRGDGNGDGKLDIADPVFHLQFSFLGGEEPACRAALDADGNGLLNITDAVYVLEHLFRGGPRPVAPFPGCGSLVSPADAALGCAASSTACQES